MRFLKQILPMVFVSILILGDAQRLGAMEWGIKGGINFSGLSPNHSQEMELKNRMMTEAGGFAILKLYRRFYVQTGVSYIKRGAVGTGSWGNEKIEAIYTFDLLEIPLLLKYRLKVFPEQEFSAGGGLFINYCLGSRQSVHFREEKRSSSILSQIHRTTCGWSVFLDANHSFKAGTVLLEIRYSQGLSPVLKSEYNQRVFFHSLSISAGFQPSRKKR